MGVIYLNRPNRYLVLWGGGVKRTLTIWGRHTAIGSALADVLREYGVDVEVRKYSTTVKGRKYVRYKLIIRDIKLTARLARLAKNPIKLRRLMRRYGNVVADVLAHMGRLRGWRALLAMFPRATLKRWLGIRPFRYGTYIMLRNLAIVRHLKPNRRGMMYKLIRMTEEKDGIRIL